MTGGTSGLPVLRVDLVPVTEFVRFWERFYAGYDEEFYQSNLGRQLDVELVDAWFAWKNGTQLSKQKAAAIRRNFPVSEQIAREASAEEVAGFLNRPGGAIWRIFWLHLQLPEDYPIYDQHVHRAMAFIEGTSPEIPRARNTVIRTYLESYRPFFERFAVCDRRLADRALWAFGKFLGSEANWELVSAARLQSRTSEPKTSSPRWGERCRNEPSRGFGKRIPSALGSSASCANLLRRDYVPSHRPFNGVHEMNRDDEARIEPTPLLESELQIEDVRLLPLSDLDRDFFLDLLENPPEPTPAFLKAAAEYKRRRSGSK
jgi:hypothetical protein